VHARGKSGASSKSLEASGCCLFPAWEEQEKWIVDAREGVCSLFFFMMREMLSCRRGFFHESMQEVSFCFGWSLGRSEDDGALRGGGREGGVLRGREADVAMGSDDAGLLAAHVTGASPGPTVVACDEKERKSQGRRKEEKKRLHLEAFSFPAKAARVWKRLQPLHHLK